jgi:dUTP pyrophosphatase
MKALSSKIQIKRLRDTAVIPTRGSEKAAGYDLYATANYEIAPHSTIKVGTGISIALPDNSFGAIFARSGLATKKGLRPANCVGVCDSDYRGEYIVPLHNDTDEMMSIEAGERIAQLIVMPFIPIEFEEVDELDETERGAGGFGSTGK